MSEKNIIKGIRGINTENEISKINKENYIKVEIVDSWQEDPLVELYRAGGWWKDGMDRSRLGELIRGSFLFAVAIDISTRKSVGMGRVISDGISDAYIQDLVVLPEWRGRGVGRMILAALLDECRARKISWTALIAEPGTSGFYGTLGFKPMNGYVPMLFSGDERAGQSSELSSKQSSKPSGAGE
jgi:aralkylamine N-acetyltransferase